MRRYVVPGISAVIVIIMTVLVVMSRFEIQSLNQEIETAQNNLSNVKSELESTETQLNQTTQELNDTQSQLSNTSDELDITKTTLQNTKQQLNTEIARSNGLVRSYDVLKNSVNSRINLTQDQMRAKITPDNYLVSQTTREIAGDYSEDVNEYWNDFNSLFQWVSTNIDYSYDSSEPLLPESLSGSVTWYPEYWRTPEETLNDKTGDCEDMALLLTSLLLSYNQSKYAVWCVVVVSDTLGEAGHMGVAFPVVGDKLTILDPTGYYFTGDFYFLSAQPASTAINSWLNRVRSTVPNPRISAVFSDTFYEEFSSTEEFIEWVINR